MNASRSSGLPTGPVSFLSDQQLHVAIAIEVFGWKYVHIERDGRITGSHPTVLTTVPMTMPSLMESESEVARLELILKRRGLALAYRRELGRIAGDFNPAPTRRQKCEAALATVRLSPMDR